MGANKLAACLLAVSLLTCQAEAVETSAASVLLMEQESGRILLERGAREERPIASITKIMTALVALEQGDLSAQYTVTEEDMAEGSSMYLRPGETLTLEELLYGLLLASGNDAALAVARCVSGDTASFVEQMNGTARRLGMEQTHFANPSGLDGEGHYSTAADMARLAAFALEHPAFRRMVSTTSITVGQRQLTNHNRLLRQYEGCIGVKTGYTRSAGRTLVSAARREDMTLVCVTLRDPDDWRDHAALLDWGFSTYRMETAAGAGQVLARLPVPGGTEPFVPLAADRALRFPVTGEERLTVQVRCPRQLTAPVIPGQRVGEALAFLDGEEVARVDLVTAGASAAREDPPPPGFWEGLLSR